MKAIILVCSARRYGNCYDFARFMQGKMVERGVETELVNFCDHEIQPCHRCNYECLAHLDSSIGHDLPCPIKDDVAMIWKLTWSADLLLMFVPNGSPPALWLSFVQRYQSLWRQEPKDLSEKISGEWYCQALKVHPVES